MSKKAIILTILYGVCLTFSANRVAGQTFCVNPSGSGESDLQTALTIAQSNEEEDIVQLVQGIYNGNFTYNSDKGFGISLLGGFVSDCTERYIHPENTIIDAQGSGSGLILDHSEGGYIFVEGLTIQNGQTSGASGGVSLQASKVENITFTSNIVRDNESTNAGGIEINSSTHNDTTCDIVFTNNILFGNTSIYTPPGISIGGGAALMTQNSSGPAGSIVLTNNTITSNTADMGGGLYLYISSGGEIKAYNNIFWGNTGVSGGDVYMEKESGATAYAYYNVAGDGQIGGDTWELQGGNINDDPKLSNNYHLKPHSPCIDTATNSAPFLPSSDFEGDNRIVDGDKDSTAIVDMGADEYIPKGVLSFLMLLLN